MSTGKLPSILPGNSNTHLAKLKKITDCKRNFKEFNSNVTRNNRNNIGHVVNNKERSLELFLKTRSNCSNYANSIRGYMASAKFKIKGGRKTRRVKHRKAKKTRRH